MKRKRVARSIKPRGRTPVIAGRVPVSLHRRIKLAAETSGRSMSEEIAWRVGMAFQWEEALGEFQQWRAKQRTDQQAIERGSLEAALRRRNWRKNPTSGEWAPPEEHGLPASRFVSDEEIEAGFGLSGAAPVSAETKLALAKDLTERLLEVLKAAEEA